MRSDAEHGAAVSRSKADPFRGMLQSRALEFDLARARNSK